MKPTNINLAAFYNRTRKTIATYKKQEPNLYAAMIEYFIKAHSD